MQRLLINLARLGECVSGTKYIQIKYDNENTLQKAV